MSILDFFKKKKKPELKEGVEPKKKVEKEVKVKKEVKKPSKVSVSKPKPAFAKATAGREKKIDLAWKILEYPHVSEKATDLTKQNKYVFRVFPKSNKKEIKKAVEDIYRIDVLNVKIIKIPRKKKMRGRVSGWKKGYKKAIVKVKEGQKIELLPR